MTRGETVRYRAGYKYQLAEDVWFRLPAWLAPRIVGLLAATPGPYGNRWTALRLTGDQSACELQVVRGYAWDGASGPMPDVRSVMRGSLAHDALYQLLRTGVLPVGCRVDADAVLRHVCREDGMSRPLAWLVWKAVRRFARHAAEPASRHPVMERP